MLHTDVDAMCKHCYSLCTPSWTSELSWTSDSFGLVDECLRGEYAALPNISSFAASATEPSAVAVTSRCRSLFSEVCLVCVPH